MNITIDQLHAEAGRGQFEIVTGHEDALKVAHLVPWRELVPGAILDVHVQATKLAAHSPLHSAVHII